MSNEEVLEIIIKAIPYPNQINRIDLSQPNVVRFTWRGIHFRVSNTLNVDESDGLVLTGTNHSILLRVLLQHARNEVTFG